VSNTNDDTTDKHHRVHAQSTRWRHYLKFGSRDLNHTVAAAIGGRLWQFASGPLTVYLIAIRFTEVEQGFFYAFSGYLGMQAFFELGLNGVLISIAGHEHATIDSAIQQQNMAGNTAPSPVNDVAYSRLADLLYKSVQVYLLAALAFFLIAGFSGHLFFARQAVTTPIQWLLPWWSLMALATFNLWLTPFLAILEGTGHARLVYRGRFIQAIFGSVTVWLALLAHCSLWTAVVSAAVQTVVQCYMIAGPGWKFLAPLLAHRKQQITIAWRATVLPMQWRIALQGIALFLATQALTPVLMETQNVSVAGRWGITWSILLALQSMAMAWINAAFPLATRFAAHHERKKLRRYWRKVTWASSSLLFGGLLAFITALLLLQFYWPSLASRFLLPSEIFVFGSGMLAYHFAASLSYLVRAQKRESLYWAATLGQLAVASSCWIAGYFGNVTTLCVAFAVTNIGFLLPLHLLAWRWDLKRQCLPSEPKCASMG
jgi:hypothetical protein